MLTLASQLSIADPTVLVRYREGEMRYDHVHEIMREYGYHDFAAQPEHFRFVRWLYTRAWWSEERLTVLFDLAMTRLVERRVLLPGVSVLERLVSSVREHASVRLWQALAHLPTPSQRALLETLLVVPKGERQTPLDRLRHAPTRVSGPALVAALRRIGVPTFLPPVFPAKDSSRDLLLVFSPLSQKRWAFFPIPSGFIDIQAGSMLQPEQNWRNAYCASI